jgi:hypothetical protein
MTKKLLQENGPATLWVQAWYGEGDAAEPCPLDITDEWTNQLFNYYLLTGFGADQTGHIQAEHPRFSDLNELLHRFFEDGEIGPIHARLTGDWTRFSGQCDENGIWFTAQWPQFETEGYQGPAIGFYFSNERGSFLQLNGTEPLVLQGLPMKKPQFSCLFHPDGEGNIRQYLSEPAPSSWSQQLFPFQRQQDEAFHAKEFFKLCKSFSEEVLVKNQGQDREQQVEFLSDSLELTRQTGEVNFENFRQEVLKEPAVIDAFEDYKQKYAGERQWNPPDQFAVSDAVQNQAKKFIKSVIKLDKNFHIYVHGNKERIEKGFDEERKLHYYRLWFDAEA